MAALSLVSRAACPYRPGQMHRHPALVAVLLAILPSLIAASTSDNQTAVTSSKEFKRALLNSSLDTIILLSPIVLDAGDWQVGPPHSLPPLLSTSFSPELRTTRRLTSIVCCLSCNGCQLHFITARADGGGGGIYPRP